MPRIVLTAQVADAQKWLKTFPNHEVALYEEVADVDWYFKHLQDPATLQAMAADGVKGDSVKVFVLDREWHA